MTNEKSPDVARSFQELRRLLSESSEGMREHVYPKLQIGDVWLIPDEISGFSNKGSHPWIVVRTCRTGAIYAELSPRTTTYKGAKRGIITPANVLPELDQKGLILLKHRRKFSVDLFRDLTYVGRLPENWVREIKNFLLGA